MKFPRPKVSPLRMRSSCNTGKYKNLNARSVRFVLLVSMAGFGAVACFIGALIVRIILWPWLIQTPKPWWWVVILLTLSAYVGVRIGRWSGRWLIRDVLAEILRSHAEQHEQKKS